MIVFPFLPMHEGLTSSFFFDVTDLNNEGQLLLSRSNIRHREYSQRVTDILPMGLTPNDPMGSGARWAGPIFPRP